MDEIKKILQSLLDVNAQFQKVSQALVEQLGNSRRLQTEYQQKLSDLEVREKAVLQKEGLIASAEEIDRQKGLLESRISEFDNREKAFAKKCSEQKAVLDQQAADLQALDKDLRQREKALEEEKASYKKTLQEKMRLSSGG